MCKVCERESAFNRPMIQFWDSLYCSYYCQLFFEQKLKKIKTTDAKECAYNYPPIKVPCENCGGDTILRWGIDYCNKAFCSNKCNNSKVKSRGEKQYFPLKILKHSTHPLLASDIAKLCDGQKRHLFTSNSISNILRIFHGRGVIERSGEHGFYQYAMTEWAKERPVKSLLR